MPRLPTNRICSPSTFPSTNDIFIDQKRKQSTILCLGILLMTCHMHLLKEKIKRPHTYREIKPHKELAQSQRAAAHHVHTWVCQSMCNSLVWRKGYDSRVWALPCNIFYFFSFCGACMHAWGLSRWDFYLYSSDFWKWEANKKIFVPTELQFSEVFTTGLAVFSRLCCSYWPLGWSDIRVKCTAPVKRTAKKGRKGAEGRWGCGGSSKMIFLGIFGLDLAKGSFQVHLMSASISGGWHIFDLTPK